MGNVTIPTAQNLPALIDKAAQTLAGARTAAEVLQAADMASVAYDAAKRASRRAELSDAVGDLTDRIRQAQGMALEIEFQAKKIFAERYSEAQARGEVAKRGQPKKVLFQTRTILYPPPPKLASRAK
jgi:hypothetical protein